MKQPIALFILGHAGTGKSFITTHFLLQRRQAGHPWAVLDKDVVSEVWSGALLKALGQDPQDRDSPFFKAHVRDLEYRSTLRIARDQLEAGVNVILPGPWSRELASMAILSATALGLPAETRVRHTWLELPLDVRKERIEQRADPRDKWKLDNWERYVEALKRPQAVIQGKIPVLNASLPLEEQLSALSDLLD